MVKLKLLAFLKVCTHGVLLWLVGIIHILKQRSNVLFGKSSYVHYVAFIFKMLFTTKHLGVNGTISILKLNFSVLHYCLSRITSSNILK